jgi:hypothetical protein
VPTAGFLKGKLSASAEVKVKLAEYFQRRRVAVGDLLNGHLFDNGFHAEGVASGLPRDDD